MSRIGIAISGGPNPAEIVDLVDLAESLGYESACVAEGHGGDQFAILAACATRTSLANEGVALGKLRRSSALPGQHHVDIAAAAARAHQPRAPREYRYVGAVPLGEPTGVRLHLTAARIGTKTISRTPTSAVVPSVAGRPGSDFTYRRSAGTGRPAAAGGINPIGARWRKRWAMTPSTWLPNGRRRTWSCNSGTSTSRPERIRRLRSSTSTISARS